MALNPQEPLPPPLPREREAMRLAEEARLNRLAEEADQQRRVLVQKRPKAKDRTPPPKNPTKSPVPGTVVGGGTVLSGDVAKRLEILTPGEKFGDYQILKCLGYDLIGSLYRVRKAREKVEKTLLVLPPALSESTDFAERFQAAREKLVGLEHPDILSPRETLQIKGRLALVSDGVTAINLGDFFETEAKENKEGTVFALPPLEVKGILTRLISTVQYAHGQGMRHLNLNPSHILRTPEGRILISGFGLVDLLGQDLFKAAASASLPPLMLDPNHVRLGTPDVIPPEVQRGEAPDHSADLYAIGVLTYWLLTGKKPTRDSKKLAALRPDLPVGWDLIVGKCLEPQPRQRYSKASQLLEDLERVDTLKIAGGRQAVAGSAGGPLTAINHALRFIPLPGPLSEGSALVALSMRLGVLVALGLLAVQGIRWIERAALGSTTVPMVAVMKVAEGESANVRLAVVPERFLLVVADQVSILNSEGILNLRVDGGPYAASIEAPGFHPSPVTLQAGNSVVDLSVTLREVFTPLTIETLPGALVVAISPSGEELVLSDPDEEGRIFLEGILKPGSYTFAASLPSHQPAIAREVALTAAPLSLSLLPEPLPGTLRLRSEPDGAEIFFRNRSVGTTNGTLTDLPVNEEFILTVRKPGYVDVAKAVRLAPGVRTLLDFGELPVATFSVQPNLRLNGRPVPPNELGRATITLQSDSPAAQGPIRSILDPNSPQFSALENVPEGEITVAIEHPDWEPFQQRFRAQKDAIVQLTVEVFSKPAEVTLDVSPANLPLSVTREDGVTLFIGDQRLLSLKSLEEISLSFSAPEHLPIAQRLTFRPGEKRRVALTFQPIPGPDFERGYTVPNLGVDLAWVPPGRLDMGSPGAEPARLPSEDQRTVVNLTRGFWMGRTEVTQGVYAALTGTVAARVGGQSAGAFPASGVSYEAAMAFCELLTTRERSVGRVPQGYAYRLPTEAEWEYAARAGTTTPFWWGDTANPTNGAFQGLYPRQFGGEVSPGGSSSFGVQPVASFLPNPWGLYDVHGNLAEWCLDDYNSRLPGGVRTDWIRRGNPNRHPLRGGSWRSFAKDARSAYRDDSAVPTVVRDDVGFRVALAPILEP